MDKQQDTLAILKLYELRRDPEMRLARQWYLSEFAPASAMDIIVLFRGGERASANFRMVTSFWDTAASLVLNGGIDRKYVRAGYRLGSSGRAIVGGRRFAYATGVRCQGNSGEASSHLAVALTWTVGTPRAARSTRPPAGGAG